MTNNQALHTIVKRINTWHDERALSTNDFCLLAGGDITAPLFDAMCKT
jgi:hypothetical protein